MRPSDQLEFRLVSAVRNWLAISLVDGAGVREALWALLPGWDTRRMLSDGRLVVLEGLAVELDVDDGLVGGSVGRQVGDTRGGVR